MNEFFGMFMPGMAAMTNIHPLLVHFPIALLDAFFLMELLGVLLKREGMRSAASWMLYLGTLGAAAAVLAGLAAEGSVGHSAEVHAILERHEMFGLTVLALSAFLSIWRLIVRARFSSTVNWIHLAVAFVTIVVMSFGADLGGLMVYKYGVGGTAVVLPEGHEHSAPKTAGGAMEMESPHGSGDQAGDASAPGEEIRHHEREEPLDHSSPHEH